MASENDSASVFAVYSAEYLPLPEVNLASEYWNLHHGSNAHAREAQRQLPHSDDRTMRGIVSRDSNGLVLSGPFLPPRDAEEAAARRYHAASWLQKMVGPLNLPSEPSEEDFQRSLRDGRVLCSLMSKVQPGFVPQALERNGPWDSSSDPSVHLKKFLAVAAEMKLPVFEVSDIDEV